MSESIGLDTFKECLEVQTFLKVSRGTRLNNYKLLGLVIPNNNHKISFFLLEKCNKKNTYKKMYKSHTCVFIISLDMIIYLSISEKLNSLTKF